MNETIKKNCIYLKMKATSLTVLLVTVFLLTFLSGTQSIREVSAVDYEEYTGTLGNADWALRIPDNWNGMLEIMCRGVTQGVIPDPLSTLSEGTLELDDGYAIAASNYGEKGLCVQAGVNSTYELTKYIIENYNVTGKVFVRGASLGGCVALLLGAKHPELYSGVLDLFGAKNHTDAYLRNIRWANLSLVELEAEMIALGITTIPPPTFSSLEEYRDTRCVNAALAIERETGGTPETHPQEYEDISPVYHANITIPVITVHGTDDSIVFYYESLMYNDSVAAAGSHLYRLYNVTGGGHNGGTSNEAHARFIELVKWSNSMWSKTYGGADNEAGTGETVQTSDGGYAISGDTNSSGAGGLDFWLIKTDADGNMEWNMTYGGVLDEVCGDMCQTTDGGYAIAGGTYSFGAGSEDFYLVKTDASGNMEWNKTYGGTDDEWPTSVVQTLDGGYSMFGFTESFGAGLYDLYLVKTDASGNMEWNMTYGGTGNENDGYSHVQCSDGGYALLGSTNSFGAGDFDVWLVRTDVNGIMEWNMTYGGTGYDGGFDIVPTSDGGYAMTGMTMSFGGVRSYLVKANASGIMEWNMTYGTPELGLHLIQTSDEGYAIVGWNFLNGQDLLIIKTDASGNMEWSKTYGETGFENGYAVLEAIDGGYVLTSTTGSFGAGGTDVWLVKVDEFGNIPESFTVAVVMLLSSVAVVVSFWFLRKRPKWKNQ